MTDEIEIDPEDAGKIPCTVEGCEATFNAERGLAIHKGRDHKTVFADEKAKEIKTKARKAPSKPCAIVGKANKFDRDAQELMVDLFAAGVAWLAIQWLNANDVAYTAEERDALLPDEDMRGVMFRPLMDGLETIKPVTKVVNTLAAKIDYIQCFLAWKEYLQTIMSFAATRKSDMEMNNGIVANGPGASDIPPDLGAVIGNGQFV